MAKPDLSRNTDVPATIAGFYYQIIIACREICREHVEAVGVETGADVVVIDETKEKSYIEAKLHTRSFNRFSDDVIKTIYNFYNGYPKKGSIKQMIFMTNAKMKNEDKALFDTWGTDTVQEIEYIKRAVLIKSIEVHSECKDKYKQFCLGISNNSPKENKELREELLEEIFVKSNSCLYTDYAVVNPWCSYETFIRKLKFEFCDKKKKELLEAIEEETEEKIKIDYLALPENVGHEALTADGAKHIFSSLVKLFYDCIVDNSQNGTKRNILVEEYKKCLSSYYKNREEDKVAGRVKRCLEKLAYDEEEAIGELNLEKEEDRAYQECYAKVKQLFLIKLQEEKGDFAFMGRYLLKESMRSQEDEVDRTIIWLIRMLAVILYEEQVRIQDIKLFFDDNLNNIEIIGKLRCCYKRAYEKTTISNIVRNMVEDLVLYSENEQIIVADASYKLKGRPCDNEKLLPEVYNIAETIENYRDHIFLESFNYKCADCLERDSIECENFWKGGGGLCKKV